MPTSVRLDPKTEMVIRRLARQTKRTKSEVMPKPSLAWRSKLVVHPGRGTPYETIEDLLGIASGEPRDPARRSDDTFREILTRQRAR